MIDDETAFLQRMSKLRKHEQLAVLQACARPHTMHAPCMRRLATSRASDAQGRRRCQGPQDARALRDDSSPCAGRLSNLRASRLRPPGGSRAVPDVRQGPPCNCKRTFAPRRPRAPHLCRHLLTYVLDGDLNKAVRLTSDSWLALATTVATIVSKYSTRTTEKASRALDLH